MIQKTIKQQNILQITILLIFMFLCPIPLKTANGVDGNELFKITVIDVGKGDCILIQTGEHTVMIDTGYKNTAENVIQFLKDHNITTIDTMIISHFHKDHVGGAAALINSRIPIKTIYMPDYKGTRSVYEDMIAALETHPEIEVIRLKEARSFTLGGAEYDIFPSSIAFDGDNDNNVSMAAMVKTDAHSAFKRSGLKYINIPDNVTSIDEKAFILSEALERVKLPAGLDAIKKNTFEGCTGLTDITIPESVTSIKASAFFGCESFMDIWFTGTEEQWRKMELKKKWDEGTPPTKNIHFNSEDPDMPDAPDEPDEPDEDRRSGSSFFRMQTLPATGFSSRFPETLPSQPSGTEYKDSGLTLLTCEDELPEGGYASRRVILAKPIY